MMQVQPDQAVQTTASNGFLATAINVYNTNEAMDPGDGTSRAAGVFQQTKIIFCF